MCTCNQIMPNNSAFLHYISAQSRRRRYFRCFPRQEVASDLISGSSYMKRCQLENASGCGVITWCDSLLVAPSSGLFHTTIDQNFKQTIKLRCKLSWLGHVCRHKTLPKTILWAYGTVELVAAKEDRATLS